MENISMFSKAFVIVLAITSTFCPLSQAREWRLFRNRARCARSSCDAPICCKPNCEPSVTPCTCVLFQLYALSANQYLYYAEYNDTGCADPQAVYTYGQFDVDQVCDGTCIAGFKCSPYERDTIPHYVGTVFNGFPTPLLHSHSMHLDPINANPGGNDWVRYTIDGKTYKAHLMLIGYRNAINRKFKGVHVAFEVKDFPPGVRIDPTPIEPSRIKRCQGMHAYSIGYDGISVLFLTDQDN